MICVALFAVVLLDGVHAHGSLREPLARQFCQPDVSKNQKFTYTLQQEAGIGTFNREDKLGGMPGFFGDPFNVGKGKKDVEPSRLYGKPCPPQAVYKEGAVIDVKLAMLYNHGGVWEVNACCEDAITQECLDANRLTHVEKNSHEFWILEHSPVRDRSLFEGKIPSSGNEVFEVYNQKWKLPPGLYGDRCVIVWTWWTAASCTFFPCDPSVCGFYNEGKNLVTHPEMRTNGDTLDPCPSRFPREGQAPQIFRNGADVAIERSGKVTSRISTLAEQDDSTMQDAGTGDPPVQDGGAGGPTVQDTDDSILPNSQLGTWFMHFLG